MFKAVGFPGFDPKFAEQEQWFQKKTWNEKSRDEFKRWFVATARKDMRWSKSLAEKEFAYFDFSYGWSLKSAEAEKREAEIKARVNLAVKRNYIILD